MRLVFLANTFASGEKRMAQPEISQGLGSSILRPPVLLSGHAQPAGRSLRWNGLLPWQTRRVHEYVESDLHARPSIRGAAEQAKLSPSYFSRRFRQSFGVTFSQFVARRRIERAQSMMVRSDSSLCQIALDCGFTDQAHFTRTFGGLTGSTPSQWRRSAVQTTGPAKAMGRC
jgi:AraC-like DNA-binding protein